VPKLVSHQHAKQLTVLGTVTFKVN